MSERGDRPGREAGGGDGLVGGGEADASVGDAERAGEFLGVHTGLAVGDDHHERAVGGEDERLDDLGDVHAEGGRAGRDVGGVVALAAHELDVGAAVVDPSREVDGGEHARGGDRGRAEGGRGRRRAFRGGGGRRTGAVSGSALAHRARRERQERRERARGHAPRSPRELTDRTRAPMRARRRTRMGKILPCSSASIAAHAHCLMVDVEYVYVRRRDVAQLGAVLDARRRPRARDHIHPRASTCRA